MQFVQADGGWRVTFLEENLRTTLPRRFCFRDPEKIREMACKGGAETTLAGGQGIEQGIALGRGGVWLTLSPAQCAALR